MSQAFVPALVVMFLTVSSQAQAWEFSDTPVCTLVHEEGGAAVRITYDPRAPEPYAIAVTRGASWPAGPVFAMRFEGGASRTIFTERHRLSPDGRAVGVSDTGFGNLLDGLEFNARVTALLGDSATGFSLAGAAEPVQRFRACATAPAV